MRRYMVTALAVCFALSSLTGCGNNAKQNKSSESTTENQLDASIDLDAKEYVKLGQYKDMVIESVKPEEISDEKLTEVMKDYAVDYAEYKEVKDRDTVEKDDTIEADIKCLVAGQEDDMYSGEDIQIKVGAKDFSWFQDMELDIDDDLIGAKSGSTVKKEFTFPNDYPFDNYAGKDGTLEVTIKRITAEQVPEITDAWVKKVLEADSVEAWKESLKSELEEDAKANAEAATVDKMWKQIQDNAKQIKEFPDDVMKKQIEAEKEMISEGAAELDIDEKAYREEYMDGLTAEEYVKRDLYNQCVKDLIIEAENLTVSDDELKQYLQENVDGEILNNTDEVLDFYGGEDTAKTEILNEKVETFVKEANTFQ